MTLESATAKGSCHQGEPTGVGPNPSQTAHLERQRGPRRKGLWQASSTHSGQWPGKQSHGAQQGNEETFQPAALKSPRDCVPPRPGTPQPPSSSEQHGAISPGGSGSPEAGIKAGRTPVPGLGSSSAFACTVSRIQSLATAGLGSLFPATGPTALPTMWLILHSQQGVSQAAAFPPKDSPD